MISECPCGSLMTYGECCEPLHKFETLPQNAERLMKSRFCAFYLKNVEYIIVTTVPTQQRLLDKSALQAWANEMHWTHLEVLSHTVKGKRHAQVHFKAYFEDKTTHNSMPSYHEELSAFVKIMNEAGECHWYFLDPTVPMTLTAKEPCLCGSGERFKRCCGVFLR